MVLLCHTREVRQERLIMPLITPKAQKKVMGL